MSQPDTIWWCDDCGLGAEYRSDLACPHYDVPQRPLVSPSALVIERDENGWLTDEPIEAAALEMVRLSKIDGAMQPYIKAWRIVNAALDALAASQKDTET